MPLKQHLKDYSTIYIVASLTVFSASTVFLAVVIGSFTDELGRYRTILTRDVQGLGPALGEAIPVPDVIGQPQANAESNGTGPLTATTKYPSQQVDRLKVLTKLLEQESPESEINSLSAQVLELLSRYEELLE